MTLDELIAHLRTRLGQKWTREERRLLWELLPPNWSLDKARSKRDPAAQARYLNSIEDHCVQLVMKRLDDKTEYQRWQEEMNRAATAKLDGLVKYHDTIAVDQIRGNRPDMIIIDDPLNEHPNPHGVEFKNVHADTFTAYDFGDDPMAQQFRAADRLRKADGRNRSKNQRIAHAAQAARQSKATRR